MTANYTGLRDVLLTGDLVLFSGEGHISTGIKLFTRSRWSHVGMVVRSDDLDSVLLWESTTLSDVLDVDTALATRGVQLVLLSQRLASYRGTIGIRRLQMRRSKAQLETLGALRRSLAGRPYEQQWRDLLCADFRFLGRAAPDFSSFFCSELVALAYQELGLLPRQPMAGRYVPADFSTGRGTVDVRLAAGVRLLPEQIVET